jgi:hypothetical protein
VRRTGEADSWTEVGVFVLNGSLDPEDEILVPRRDAWMIGRRQGQRDEESGESQYEGGTRSHQSTVNLGNG